MTRATRSWGACTRNLCILCTAKTRCNPDRDRVFRCRHHAIVIGCAAEYGIRWRRIGRIGQASRINLGHRRTRAIGATKFRGAFLVASTGIRGAIAATLGHKGKPTHRQQAAPHARCYARAILRLLLSTRSNRCGSHARRLAIAPRACQCQNVASQHCQHRIA